jgi:F-type H+-transporting ATPase subunit a
MNMDESAAYIAFQIGPIAISHTVMTTWLIMLGFIAFGLLFNKSGYCLIFLEAVIEAICTAMAEVLPASTVREVFPFVATLWLYILVANLFGLIPEMHAPTGDLSATAALAVLVFFAAHWFGVKERGWRNHFRHYLEPSVILLPFHIISELTRTLSLAIRLFGNIMSLEMAVLMILFVAGFLAPIPLMMLHIIEAMVQAYIFGMLALIYIGAGLEQSDSEISEQPRKKA